MKDLDTFIIAGGEGKRFRSVSRIPKIFAKIENTRLINIILKNLKKYKIKNVKFFVGKDEYHFKKFLNFNNKNYNFKIIEEENLLGTAGCFSKIEKKTLKNNLLIIFGDLLFEIDLKKIYDFHKFNKSDVTILSHPSDHLFDSDIVDVNNLNRVNKIYFKPHRNNLISKNLTMAGIFIIKKKLLKYIPSNKKFDFSKNFLNICLKKKYKVFSYQSREYCKDLGTPSRFKKVLKDFKSKKLNKYKFTNKMRAIFLDRDGVINVDQGPLKYSDPLNFLPNTLKALKIMRKLDYLIILITNQSAVAKGFLSLNKLEQSFKALETYLSKKNFYFDGIYYCPHHPETGYKNENKKYKVTCTCRKPKPGMLFKARKDFNIDLKKSYFIGDTLRDYKAAKSARVKSIIVKKLNNNFIDYIYKKDLLQAIKYIKTNDNI